MVLLGLTLGVLIVAALAELVVVLVVAPAWVR